LHSFAPRGSIRQRTAQQILQAEAQSAREASSSARNKANRLEQQLVAAERARLEAVTQAQALRDASQQRDHAEQERQRLEGLLAAATASLAETEDSARSTADRLRLAEEAVHELTATIAQLQQQVAHAEATEDALSKVRAELAAVTREKAAQEEEFAAREAQLRALNKTLKEEVRKLGRSGGPSAASSGSGTLWSATQVSPRLGSPTAAGNSGGGVGSGGGAIGEINLEYLKHCVLKYMEFDDERTVWLQPKNSSARVIDRCLTCARIPPLALAMVFAGTADQGNRPHAPLYTRRNAPRPGAHRHPHRKIDLEITAVLVRRPSSRLNICTKCICTLFLLIDVFACIQGGTHRRDGAEQPRRHLRGPCLAVARKPRV